MADQVKYTNRLQDSRVLVIGGSSGIGFSVAEASLEHGSTVIIASSNKLRVDTAVFRLKTSYPSSASKIYGLTVDLSKAETLEPEIQQLFESTLRILGGSGGDGVDGVDGSDIKLDHVVFTAGDTPPIIALADMTMPKLHQAGQVRFFAPLMVAKYLASYTRASRSSSYTITSGTAAEKPLPGWAVPASYLGGHGSMVRALALDLRPLRVNAVVPGAVRTEFWDMHIPHKDELMEGLKTKMATGFIGQPEHVAEGFLYCMRDLNVDGVVIRTDGGAGVM